MEVLYCFKDKKLQAIAPIENMTQRKITKLIGLQIETGRTVVRARAGRSICCECHLDLGECDIPAGKLSHGYCEEHLNEAMAEIKTIPVTITKIGGVDVEIYRRGIK